MMAAGYPLGWLDYHDGAKAPHELLDLNRIIRLSMPLMAQSYSSLPIFVEVGLWFFGRAFPLLVLCMGIVALNRAWHYFRAKHQISAGGFYRRTVVTFGLMALSLSGLGVYSELPLSRMSSQVALLTDGGALGAEIVSLLQRSVGDSWAVLLLLAGAMIGILGFLNINPLRLSELIGTLIDELSQKYVSKKRELQDRSLGEIVAQAREQTLMNTKPHSSIDIIRTSRLRNLFEGESSLTADPSGHATRAINRLVDATQIANQSINSRDHPSVASVANAFENAPQPSQTMAMPAQSSPPLPVYRTPYSGNKPLKILSTPSSPLPQAVPIATLISAGSKPPHPADKEEGANEALTNPIQPAHTELPIYRSTDRGSELDGQAHSQASGELMPSPSLPLDEFFIADAPSEQTATSATALASVAEEDLEETQWINPPKMSPPLDLSLSENRENAFADLPPKASAESADSPDDVDGRWTKWAECRLPPINLLDTTPAVGEPPNDEVIRLISQQIEGALKSFGVVVQVKAAYPGPVITRYDIALASGVKGSQIVNLSKDLARTLSVGSIRVVENIPGKPWMGLEVPNERRQMVKLAEILSSAEFQQDPSPLSMAIGKDIGGNPKTLNLAKMPHLLVAGTTGSGKSVGINDMIISMLYKATPNEVRMVMIDPKMVELSVYGDIPHLVAPVITDMKQAVGALNWCVGEMERREQLLSRLAVRNIGAFNQKINNANARGEPIADPLEIERLEEMGATDFSRVPPLLPLPYLVVIVDEFADLFMVIGKKVEEVIARLAQKGRAGGIHIILATQRPSVDVVTGIIKANVPARIAFQVSSKIDSRTILDQQGAEALLGQGDMLFYRPGEGSQRLHGAFVSDDEVNAVAQYWREVAQPKYLVRAFEDPTEESAKTNVNALGGQNEYDLAVQIVMESNNPSISYLQRRLSIGFNKAAKIIEQMQEEGIISSPQKNGKRVVIAPRNV